MVPLNRRPVKARGQVHVDARFDDNDAASSSNTNNLMCSNFEPNPFKLGFCVNCQKQHQRDLETGEIASSHLGQAIEPHSVAKKKPVRSKPTKYSCASPQPHGEEEAYEPRESDVDLTALLQQRREILKLLEQKKSREKKKKDKVERSQQRNPTTMRQQQRNNPRGRNVVPTGQAAVFAQADWL